MKYRILYDYGGYEGHRIDDSEFDSVDEAVKHAVAQNYSTPFRIISIHWEPHFTKMSPQERGKLGAQARLDNEM